MDEAGRAEGGGRKYEDEAKAAFLSSCGEFGVRLFSFFAEHECLKTSWFLLLLSH